MKKSAFDYSGFVKKPRNQKINIYSSYQKSQDKEFSEDNDLMSEPYLNVEPEKHDRNPNLAFSEEKNQDLETKKFKSKKSKKKSQRIKPKEPSFPVFTGIHTKLLTTSGSSRHKPERQFCP